MFKLKNSNIIGIGIDLLKIDRIAKVYARFPEAFPKKILTSEEIKKIPENENKKIRFLSKRFAAKEAFAKALGTGFGADLHFHDIEIHHELQGRPYFKIKDHLMEKYEIDKLHLSISDEIDQVIAFSLIEKIKS